MISETTLAQIGEVKRQKTNLILCDVDEVILQFVGPLEDYLNANDFHFLSDDYRLTGNIVHSQNQRPATQEEVSGMIHGFFADCTHAQSIVPGAVDTLIKYRDAADIIFLTNIPHAFRQDRIETLTEFGLPFPVITNEGSKGPAADLLRTRDDENIFFLDDSPMNLASVKKTIPTGHMIHFMHDQRFTASLGPIEAAALQTHDWADIDQYFSDLIG